MTLNLNIMKKKLDLNVMNDLELKCLCSWCQFLLAIIILEQLLNGLLLQLKSAVFYEMFEFNFINDSEFKLHEKKVGFKYHES